jgi:hypothetical protein
MGELLLKLDIWPEVQRDGRVYAKRSLRQPRPRWAAIVDVQINAPGACWTGNLALPKRWGQQHPIRPPSRKHNLDKAAIGFSLMRLMLQSVVKASGVRRREGEAADGQK